MIKTRFAVLVNILYKEIFYGKIMSKTQEVFKQEVRKT